MGVQLNIKDTETVELARELAKKLGKTVTETIREALEEKARAREAEIAVRIAKLDTLLAEIHANLPDEVRGMTSKQLMNESHQPLHETGTTYGRQGVRQLCTLEP